MAEDTKIEKLLGMWLTEPTGEKIPDFWPTALFFIDDTIVVRFDVGYVKKSKEIATVFRTYGYILDGDFMRVARGPEDNEGIRGGGWRLTDDDKLVLELGDEWATFIRADVADLVEAGFDEDEIESVLTATNIASEEELLEALQADLKS